MAVWARANENVRRLALVYACTADYRDVRITTPVARWAYASVEHQTLRMLYMAGGTSARASSTAAARKYLRRVAAYRVRHGEQWMPFWQVCRKHLWKEREGQEVRNAPWTISSLATRK